MASQHTQHYQLNQWQATDQVLRTDFNADNVRLEAALAGKAELAGKVGLIMLSLPLFQKIAELAVSLMNGKAVG